MPYFYSIGLPVTTTVCTLDLRPGSGVGLIDPGGDGTLANACPITCNDHNYCQVKVETSRFLQEHAALVLDSSQIFLDVRLHALQWDSLHGPGPLMYDYELHFGCASSSSGGMGLGPLRVARTLHSEMRVKIPIGRAQERHYITALKTFAAAS